MARSKGISPLIAAVLLIAFTIAVAGLAGPFLTEITKKAQGDTIKKNQDIVSSTDIQLEISSVEFDSTTGEYTVNLRNSGTSEAKNITVTIEGDNPVQKKIDKEIKAGEIHTFTISTDHSSKANKLTAESRNYPVKTDYDLSNAETSSSTLLLNWKTSSDWDNALDESGVVHESVSNTDHQDASELEIGYSAKNPINKSELEAYWPLHEDSGSTTKDLSSNNRDGNLHGAGPGGTGTVSGISNTSAYDFDGSDDNIVSQSNFNIWSNGEASIAIWVKWNNVAGSSTEYVLGHGPGTNNFLHLINRNGKWGSFFQVGDENDIIKGPSISTGTWNYFVATVNSSKHKVYVNSTEEASSSHGFSPSNVGSGEIRVGSRVSANDNNADIETGEIRVYNKSLNNSDIQKLFDVIDKESYLTTDWKTYPKKKEVSDMNLTEVKAELKGHTVEVVVESDTSGDGNVDESSDTVTLDGSSSYQLSGLSTNNDKFRLQINLSTNKPTETPIVDRLKLKATNAN